MKKYLCTIILLCVTLSLFGCKFCRHEWKEATFAAPKSCTLCGKTKGEPLPVPESFNIGDILTTSKFEMTYISLTKISELSPENGTEPYIYFTPADGKAYYDITISVKNIGETDYTVTDELFAVLVLNNTTDYYGFCITEAADKSELLYTRTSPIASGDTATVHFLTELPKNTPLSSVSAEIEIHENRVRCTNTPAETKGTRITVWD